jgi:hypothetical protein
MLWSQEFTHSGPVYAGTATRHELRILRRWPDDVCVTLGNGTVTNGETETVMMGLGDTLRNCLSAVPQTSPSRHSFQITLTGSPSSPGAIGGGDFELPAESRMWQARNVVRRITQNDWTEGGVVIRETWEFWE